MADYSQVNDYSAKDVLATGDPAKLIKGADVDAEFSAISTAIASKFDSTDVASAAEAAAGTSNTVVMTPARVTTWAQGNAGIIADVQSLADPDADRLLFWDDSAGAGAFLTVGTGLSISTTTISVDETGFTRTLTAGNGLSGGGDLSADRTFDLDFNELTGVAIASGDELAFGDVSDSNTVKKVTFANFESALTVANMADGSTGGVDHSAVSIATAADSGLTGGGDITATRNLSVDIAGTTQETTIDGTNDEIIFYDASAAANRAVPIETLVGSALGDGKWYSTSGSATSTEATLVFDTAEYDSLTKGTFNTGTGELTVGSSAARFLVIAQAVVTAQNAGSDSDLKIQLAGADKAHDVKTTFSGYGATNQHLHCSTVISASAGQVIRVRISCDTTETLGTGSGKTFVSIVELS
jgi:hypothetical protein